MIRISQKKKNPLWKFRRSKSDIVLIKQIDIITKKKNYKSVLK